MKEKKVVKEKEKIYRFGNLVLEHFPSIEKESLAAYQLRSIQNDKLVEWDEGTMTYGWIDYIIKEKGGDKNTYEYLGNILLMYFNLACEWIPTPEGLNIMAKAYIDDVKRRQSKVQESPKDSEEENQKIIEEERKNYEMLHGEIDKTE